MQQGYKISSQIERAIKTDVKETFARSLYLRFSEKGLMAFLDKEEMQ
jgi:hypothetical protein